MQDYPSLCCISLFVKNPGGPGNTGPEFDNCKVLDNTLQLSWRVDNDNSQVRFRLCGCTARYIQVIIKSITHTNSVRFLAIRNIHREQTESLNNYAVYTLCKYYISLRMYISD